MKNNAMWFFIGVITAHLLGIQDGRGYDYDLGYWAGSELRKLVWSAGE